MNRPDDRQKQIERLTKVKQGRDPQKVASALADLKKAASHGDNLMPSLIQAVKAYATLGEMIQILKGFMVPIWPLGSLKGEK